jgi:hypothetical protein
VIGAEAKHLGATLGTEALRHPETGEWIVKLPKRFERVLDQMPVEALTDEALEALEQGGAL